jgi:outer membrane lipoprotein
MRNSSIMRYSSALLLSLVLSGCATGPSFDTREVDAALTPKVVTADSETAIGKQVQWGGTIVKTSNLKQRTQIEVLAYPLSSRAKPQLDSDTLGRFLIEKDGYLEPASYAAGRMISVVGRVTATRLTQIGEASYEQPVVEAGQLYLWPPDQPYSGSGVQFGVGVGSGGGGWGTGIGVGF